MADDKKATAKLPALPTHYITIVAAIASGVAYGKGAGYITEGSAVEIARAAVKVLDAATVVYHATANNVAP